MLTCQCRVNMTGHHRLCYIANSNGRSQTKTKEKIGHVVFFLVRETNFLWIPVDRRVRSTFHVPKNGNWHFCPPVGSIFLYL